MLVALASPRHTKLSHTIAEGLRLAGYATQRTAWRLRYRRPQFDAPPHDPIVVVLGMHRSGTSAAVGILEDLGFAVPATLPPDGTGENKHGTREPVELTWLLARVLKANASSWHRPPASDPKYLRGHVAERNRLIEQCAGKWSVLKDPRMLLVLDFWEGVAIKPMAVVRNPIDVAESLVRRGEPVTRGQCIDLWKTYNRALLAFAEAHDCPIAFFDRPNFSAQVVRCVHELGYGVSTTTHFFDEQIVRSRTEDWRELMGDQQTIALYDDLTRFAVERREESGAPASAKPGDRPSRPVQRGALDTGDSELCGTQSHAT